MSELGEHVSLTITQDALGVARASLNLLGILSHNATFAGASRLYEDIDAMSIDWVPSSPEWRAGNAAFSQDPRPEGIVILKASAASAPTQTYHIEVARVLNSHDYQINVVGQGFTDQVALATSDSSATNDEIVNALVTQLNAIVGKNFTATATGSVGSKVITATGNTPGAWFSLEVNDVTDLGIWQIHSDPGITAELAAIQIQDSSWYGLVTLYNSTAYVLAAAAWCESQTKLYIPDVQDTRDINLTVGNGGVADNLHTLSYARTAAIYHPRPAAFIAAAWMGRVFPITPGGDNWKFKTLAGIPPVKSTAPQRKNLRDRAANSYQLLGGSSRTWEGTCADGDFIDVVRGIDALEDDVVKSVFEAMSGPDKLPYTDGGIAVIKSAVAGAIKRAILAGTLDGDQGYTVTAPKVVTILKSEKRRRNLPDVKFNAVLAGSINKVDIAGRVSV